MNWSVPVCFGLNVEHSYKESCSFNKYHSLKENMMHVILKMFDWGGNKLSYKTALIKLYFAKKKIQPYHVDVVSLAFSTLSLFSCNLFRWFALWVSLTIKKMKMAATASGNVQLNEIKQNQAVCQHNEDKTSNRNL